MHLFQRRAAQDRGRAAEERGVPAVEPALDRAVEHLVLGRRVAGDLEIALDRIGIEEDVRRLHHEEPLVVTEVSDGLLQEVAHRGVVGVEHDDEFGGRMLQPVIQVAGLRHLVARTGQVLHVELGAQGLHRGLAGERRLGDLGVVGVALLIGRPVVKQPDGQEVRIVVHALGRGQRVGHEVHILVIGRHEHIDGGRVGRDLHRRARPQRIDHNEDAADEHDDAVHLGDQDDDRGCEVGKQLCRRQRAADPPVNVFEDQCEAGDDAELPDIFPRPDLIADKDKTDGGSRKSELSVNASWQCENSQQA